MSGSRRKGENATYFISDTHSTAWNARIRTRKARKAGLAACCKVRNGTQRNCSVASLAAEEMAKMENRSSWNFRAVPSIPIFTIHDRAHHIAYRNRQLEFTNASTARSVRRDWIPDSFRTSM